jgi:hypothetical protein
MAEHTHIVESVEVVSVTVGKKDGIQISNMIFKCLNTEFGTGIYDNTRRIAVIFPLFDISAAP